MAKIYGLFGALTGKLADTVMSVRNGEQIARKYQPVVFNPSTPAQVESRAKLKLLSQLSAVMAPYIAIPKQGPVSSRNLFTKVNYGALTYDDNQANVELDAVKLTTGVLYLPTPTSTRVDSSVNVTLPAAGTLGLSRVVYVAFVINPADNTLRFAGSAVVNEAGSNNDYATTIPVGASAAKAVIYAYGVRDNTDAARAKFSNLQAIPADEVARIIVSRTLTDADISLTETTAIMDVPV